MPESENSRIWSLLHPNRELSSPSLPLFGSLTFSSFCCLCASQASNGVRSGNTAWPGRRDLSWVEGRRRNNISEYKKRQREEKHFGSHLTYTWLFIASLQSFGFMTVRVTFPLLDGLLHLYSAGWEVTFVGLCHKTYSDQRGFISLLNNVTVHFYAKTQLFLISSVLARCLTHERQIILTC